MTILSALFQEYSKSHQHPLNKRIHFVCVPLILWSLLGILHSLPHPEWMGRVSFAHILISFGLGYYARFRSRKVLIYSFLMIFPFWIWTAVQKDHLFAVSLIIFVLAWVGQFYGHKIEGKKPSFFQDIFFLLIGPLWVIEGLLNRFQKSLLD